MRIFSVAKNYLVWHYSTAYNDMLHIWWNYIWFVNHLFSVPDVIMSWIAPFKRLQEDKVNILLKPEDFFANIFVNIMMRIVGFIIRSALITIALICFTIVIVGGLLLLVIWTLLPMLIVYFLINSIGLFIG